MGTRYRVMYESQKKPVALKEMAVDGCMPTEIQLLDETTQITVLRLKGEYKSLQADWAVMDQPSGQFRSIGLQVNLPEKCTSTTEETTPQYIVDEEAILQLMRTCPVCNKKCRCSKHTRGPYLIVYQSCYFCDYQRKWASQLEATTMNIHKTQTLTKRKLPAKGEVNTKAESSQPNRTGVSEHSASPEEKSQHT